MSVRMKFALGLATSGLEGTTDVPCGQEHFRLGPLVDIAQAYSQLAAYAPTMRQIRIELLCLSPRRRTAHGAVLRHHSYRGVQGSRWPPCAASVRD